jgi:plasmid stabilization system protein ParE
MRVKVVILASAERDLKDLRAYIVKNFSAGDWRVTYAKLKETIRNVQDFPLAGSIRTRLNSSISDNTDRSSPD